MAAGGDLTLSQITDLSQTVKLRDIIGQGRPGLQRMITSEGEEMRLATFSMFKGKDWLGVISDNFSLQVNHEGTHPQKTWSDYKEKIRDSLSQKIIVDGPGKQVILNWITNKIHDLHFEKFKYWPSYDTQKTRVELFGTLCEVNSNLTYYATCTGWIEVEDAHDSRGYRTKCCTYGDQNIRVRGVVLDVPALNGLDKQALADPSDCKKKCLARYATKKSMYSTAAGISWD